MVCRIQKRLDLSRVHENKIGPLKTKTFSSTTAELFSPNWRFRWFLFYVFEWWFLFLFLFNFVVFSVNSFFALQAQSMTCILIAAISVAAIGASFQYGYNIAVVNAPAKASLVGWTLENET